MNFHGVTVPLGAGIGLVGKDDLLIQLLLELDIKYSCFPLDYEAKDCIPVVQKLYDNMKTITPEMTFLDYLKATLNHEELVTFRRYNGFTDFYEADALTTMLYYSIDENCTKYIVFSVDWSEIIRKLTSRVTVINKCKALRISGKHPHFQIHTTSKTLEKSDTFYAKNVVIATTISGLREVLSEPLRSIYDRVRAHPFMRIYGTFSGRTLKAMKKKYEHMTIVPNRLHFVTHMESNVFMIGYTDGEDAISLYNEINTKDAYLVLEKELGYRMDDYYYSFWAEGVHYYSPGGVPNFELLRHPTKGIHVVGEAVSMSQGWVGGALETVDEIL